MLVCFGLFGLLLYNTVVANAVCSFTYSHRDKIKALSLQYEKRGYSQCEYHIEAPKHNYIKLNFTRLFGFWPTSSMHTGVTPAGLSSDYDSDACLPPEVVLREKSDREKQIGRICKNSPSVLSPLVFHSKLNIIKITYIWVENHSSGFTVDFEFHRSNSSCVHICDDGDCLSDHQLCDQPYKCADTSADDTNCPPSSPSTENLPSSPNADLIKTLAVIISIILMPGLFIIICVVSPCRIGSRMWRRRRRSRDRLEHSQIPPDSQVCEVVYVPTTGTPSSSQDKLLEKKISQVREHRIRVQSAQTDTMLDLPPQIAISKDGEEGYIESQKHIMFKRPCLYDQLFRPPPNRTVHDRESPPPYYSNSASVETLEKPPTRIVRDSNGYPKIQRCYSMSSSVASANSHRSAQKQLETKTHHRTMSTISASGRMRTHSASSSYDEQTDEPPDLRGVIPSDIKQVSPHMDSNV